MFCRIIASFSACLLLVQGQAEHRLGVDGELRAVAIEEVAHLVVVDVGVDEHHVDEGVEVVGVLLAGPASSVGGVLEQLHLLGLIVLEPLDAAFEHAGDEGDVVLPWRSAGRGRRRPWCAASECSPQPENQPQPPSVSCISVSALTPAFDHLRDLVLVEDRVAVEALPAAWPARWSSPISWALRLVRFSWIVLEVELHPLQDVAA